MKDKYLNLVDVANLRRLGAEGRTGLSRAQVDFQTQLSEQSAGIAGFSGSLMIPFYSGDFADAPTTDRRKEKRDLSVAVGGSYLPSKDVPEIGDALRDNLVLEALGARVFGGLKGDCNFPGAGAQIAATWKSENAAADESSPEFLALNLAPKRITAYLDVSQQLLDQNPVVAESFLRAELMAALAVEVQRAAIAGTGADNQPTGILSTAGIGSVALGTNGAAPSLTNLVDLEFAVTGTAKANKGNCGWILSPYVRRKLRLTQSISGAETIWPLTSAYQLLGHSAGVTPSSPDNLTKGSATEVCSAIIFGEMSELIIAFWGPGIAVEAVRSADQAKVGMLTMVATAYANCGVRQPSAFAAIKDALCA